ncbi:MAG: transcription termination/antitermination protein NusA [Parcubacteria group bacterium]|nr:transcription termination/antitermination protein NusA [Parcubacteria group bacterium]
MDTKTFSSVVEQICEEKGIAKEKVLETIEMALAAAYKKEYDRRGQNIKIKFDLDTGQMQVSQIKLVVDLSMLKSEEEEALKIEDVGKEEEEELEKKVRFNPERHIMAEEVSKLTAKETNLSKDKLKKIKPGDEIEFPLEIKRDFGRIAAQTAKQVIIQRIREAEREVIYDEYKGKEGQIVSGVIQRIENNNVFIDIGKTTGLLFPEEQIPREHYRMGQRLRVYIIEVQKGSHGPTIALSRAHPKMVSQLFALEVPEISAGTVEIKSIAREAGSRSKIAVVANEERVDPIGSMIGQKGTRVQAVINELAGEKIDIIEWSKDQAKFISSSLSPAKVIDVKIDKEKNQAKVIVPEDQLSLAIGAKGQNVRLAAKLTNWKIDITIQELIKKKPTKTKTVKDKKPRRKVGIPTQKASGKTVKKSKTVKKEKKK